jgi:hypothetical protein
LYGNSKKAVFSDILDKVNGNIEGWRSKTLLQAGKTTPIKTVVSALPSYAMSFFCSRMVSVNNWTGLLKVSGGVSQRTKPAISHLNLGILYVCQRIRVVLDSDL